MSDTLIKQLNSITQVNLCDPITVSMDDWNEMLDNVSEVLRDLEQAEARVAELEDKNAKFSTALKEKMILTEGAYVLRKQAEAVETFSEWCVKRWAATTVVGVDVDAKDYAQRLRQQADEIDRERKFDEH